MAGPLEKEKSLLTEFRASVQDLNLEDDSDMFLLRWIRAREYNLKQAENMLRQHIQWRKDNDIDSILTWEPPSEITSVNPIDILGYDHDNNPVAVIPFGRWDVKSCIPAHRYEFIRYVDKLYVKILDMMKGKTLKSTGVPVTQFVVVYDCEGLSARLLTSYATIDAMMETLRRFEANHPETLKACYIVNASRVFELLFRIVKPILSQRTFGKVLVYNTNGSKWKPVLAKEIPTSILPTSLGGNNANSVINTFTRGGSKKAKCDKSNGKGDTESLCSVDEDEENGYVGVTIGAGEKLPVHLHVELPNTVLNYSFKTVDHDIGFSLLKGESEEVVQYARVNSHVAKEEGRVVCDKEGQYTLLFDNSYSRLRSKVLHYKVQLETEGNKSNTSPTPSSNGINGHINDDSTSL